MTTLSVDGIDPNTVYALLPESLKEIADLIGVESTIILINVHGGTHIYIPHYPQAIIKHPIAVLIGSVSFKILTLRWGGSHLQIPKADTLARLVRNKQIQEDAKTQSRKKLAVSYNMTERAIRDILSQPIPAAMGRKPSSIDKTDQLDLFKTGG